MSKKKNCPEVKTYEPVEVEIVRSYSVVVPAYSHCYSNYHIMPTASSTTFAVSGDKEARALIENFRTAACLLEKDLNGPC